MVSISYIYFLLPTTKGNSPAVACSPLYILRLGTIGTLSLQWQLHISTINTTTCRHDISETENIVSFSISDLEGMDFCSYDRWEVPLRQNQHFAYVNYLEVRQRITKFIRDSKSVQNLRNSVENYWNKFPEGQNRWKLLGIERSHFISYQWYMSCTDFMKSNPVYISLNRYWLLLFDGYTTVIIDVRTDGEEL